MELLYKRLPKDLVYIIEDYAKDRTNYDRVIKQIEFQSTDYGNYWLVWFPWYARLFWVSDKLEKKYQPQSNCNVYGQFKELPPKRPSEYC